MRHLSPAAHSRQSRFLADSAGQGMGRGGRWPAIPDSARRVRSGRQDEAPPRPVSSGRKLPGATEPPPARARRPRGTPPWARAGALSPGRRRSPAPSRTRSHCTHHTPTPTSRPQIYGTVSYPFFEARHRLVPGPTAERGAARFRERSGPHSALSAGRITGQPHTLARGSPAGFGGRPVKGR